MLSAVTLTEQHKIRGKLQIELASDCRTGGRLESWVVHSSQPAELLTHLERAQVLRYLIAETCGSADKCKSSEIGRVFLSSVYRRTLSRNVLKIKVNRNPGFAIPPQKRERRKIRSNFHIEPLIHFTPTPPSLLSPLSLSLSLGFCWLLVFFGGKLFPSPQRNKVIKLKRKCFRKCWMSFRLGWSTTNSKSIISQQHHYWLLFY